MATYNLTINDAQAVVISRALELYSRIGMGQLGSLADHPDIRSRVIKKDGWNLMTIGEKLGPIKGELFGLTRGTYKGIHSEEIDESNRVAYDVHQVIRNKLAWDRAREAGETDGIRRDWVTMIQVDYDDPCQTSHSTPLATLT